MTICCFCYSVSRLLVFFVYIKQRKESELSMLSGTVNVGRIQAVCFVQRDRLKNSARIDNGRAPFLPCSSRLIHFLSFSTVSVRIERCRE